ncbi:MAG TPA: hypothetical protein VIT41_11295 [Microlunatus sp.]
MATESPQQLRARVAALEAENAALRSSPATPEASHHRSRTVLAVVLILVGVLLAPVAVVTGWAKWTLSDTERFVATYAPLSSSPEVQAYVVDEAMAAVDARVDLDDLTQQLVDGLIALGTGPRATAALQTLQSTAVNGLRSLIRDGVSEFVASDEFDAAWADALRIGHTQLMATLSNDPAAVATISEDGSLGIPLGPIVERVKAGLVERGITVAARIPPVDRNIVLVQSDQLPMVQVAYGITLAVGTWLPWVVLALLVGGVLVANRRSRALLWAAGGFAFAMAMLAIMFAVGRIALVAAVPASLLPGSVSGLFYDTATEGMRSTAVAAAVLGLAVVLVGWLSGPYRTPSRLRDAYAAGVDGVRKSADARGLGTGRVGLWVHRRRALVFGLIAVAAGLVVMLTKPLTLSVIGWTAFWAAVAVVIVTLVERPDSVAPSAGPVDATAVTAPTESGSVDREHVQHN